MGSIRRAPRSRRWEARYRDPGGRQRTRTFDRKADAQVFLSGVDVDIHRGGWLDPAGGRTLLCEWAEQWWLTTTNLRPSTRARDEGYLNRYILDVFGDRQLNKITQLDVRAWVAELSERGLAPATVVKAYQILGKLLGSAVDAGLVASSPCRKVSLPRVEREEMRFLTPEQVAHLADAIHPRYRALVLLGAYGGLRIGEMAGLRRRRVDVGGARVDVAEICVEVEGHLSFGAPKTRAGRRTITLPRPVMDEVCAHLERWSGEDLVFTGPGGGPFRVGTWRQRFWRPAVVAAEVEPLRPHDLRHTAVALWIAAGARELEVARRAGHTSVSFTLDRYGHLFPGVDEALSARLAAMYVAAPPPPPPS